jgi:hypothetical protein
VVTKEYIEEQEYLTAGEIRAAIASLADDTEVTRIEASGAAWDIYLDDDD